MDPNLIRSWIAIVAHPSKWILIDRDFLNEIVDAQLSNADYNEFMDALHHFRIMQQMPPLPPASVVTKKFEALKRRPMAAQEILSVPECEDPLAAGNQRKFRRSAKNVNYFVWGLLNAAGMTDFESLNLNQIQLAEENAALLAKAARPGGQNTSGRTEIPGMTDLVAQLVAIQRRAGGIGPIWYWDESQECFRGFLHGLIYWALAALEIITELEILHGGIPPDVPILVAKSDLYGAGQTMDLCLSEAATRDYLRKARSR